MFKHNKGYSLLEIGAGIIIITVFLLFSVGLFNACYNNYRRIKARNLAMDRAVYHMEKMLQTQSDELAGYYIRISDDIIIPNPCLEDFVIEKFESFKSKYATFSGVSEDNVEVPDVGDTELMEFIVKYADDVFNAYIYNEAHSEATQKQLDEGSYAFMDENGKVEELKEVLDNENTFEDDGGNEYIASNNGAIKIVKEVHRIPAHDGNAFGNNVLTLKVTAYYTKEFTRNMSEDDMETIVLEAVKVK